MVEAKRSREPFWRGRNVLLTGHTGFKGAWLSLWLQRLGAQVMRYDRYTPDRAAISQSLAEEHGMAVIPPFDHPDVMAGQGTIALEIAVQAYGATPKRHAAAVTIAVLPSIAQIVVKARYPRVAPVRWRNRTTAVPA